MRKKIIIWGAGGHALVIADAIRSNDEDIAGFIDTVNLGRKRKKQLLDRPVWESLQEAVLDCKITPIEIALGFGHCAARFRLVQELKRIGVALRTVIHRNAIVSSLATIGRGVYVAPTAVIEARSNIGDGVIVNAAAVVCHECLIGQAVAVCPGVRIGGQTKIGEKCWLGISSTIIDKVTIGGGCFIGAGATVAENLPKQVVAYGVPARIIRKATLEF